MHVHLPKPLHGWREFVGEVGIIVLGVLLALAAEQAVEAWHWHKKIRDAEGAMRLELAEDDGPQAYGRILIGPCLDAQLTRIHNGAGAVDAGSFANGRLTTYLLIAAGIAKLGRQSLAPKSAATWVPMSWSFGPPPTASSTT